MANLETYKARWADFLIDCKNLDSSRRWLRDGYANEDLGATDEELWDRVFRFEGHFAHLPVFQRAERLMAESYGYADL